MKENRMTVLNHSLIWFGAAISIAEILTGTLLAPLGLKKALAAIILGHLIGGTLMYFAGLIGAKTERSAMETVKLTFGNKGGLLFSSLNVLQLVGWTAVMIFSGAAAAQSVMPLAQWIWCLAIAALILLWVFIGIGNVTKINIVTMSALLILSLLMSKLVFFGGSVATLPLGGMSFGSAVELAVAMPLSWLPLISDYTRRATHKPQTVTFVGVAVYGLTSCWMYAIGVGAALYTGKSDVAEIMSAAGFGIAAVLTVLASTVTTTFLDVYSAGVSAASLSKKLNEKPVAVAACLVGALIAICTPIAKFESFLYLISSVFAPMIAVQIVQSFILRRNSGDRSFDGLNLVVWAAGFGLYRVLLNQGFETVVGLTVPVMVATAVLALVLGIVFPRTRSHR